MNRSQPNCPLVLLARPYAGLLAWSLVAGLTLALPGWGPAQAADGSSGPLNLSDRVKPRPVFPGRLRASDVCIRSLRPRPINAQDPHDTLQAIRDFHATRLEWTYGLTKEFIAKVKALGCTASGACANGSLEGVTKQGPEWYKDYSALDLNGNAVEAPWMRAWPGHALWHCVNNPAAREGYLNYVKAQVDIGVQDLQRDDPTMNYHATRWGACFCRHCMDGFRTYLQQHTTPELLAGYGIPDLVALDYAQYLRSKDTPVGDAFAKVPDDPLKRMFAAFQEESTMEFHRWWRRELNAYAGRYVAVSSNNGVRDFGPIHRLFDCYIGELSYSQAQPETLEEAARQVEELGSGQTVTMPLRREPGETRQWIDTTRRTIATIYALGMHIEAPWDTYLPEPDAVNPPRYFGKPEDYSDLFGLVRAQARLLDDYEPAAATGGMIVDDRWIADAAPVTIWSANPRLFAFTRALPGKQDAPIVVHLVDWSGEPKPFTVSLNPEVLFAGRPFSVSLVTPKPYDRPAHEAAFASGDYGPLAQEASLASGPVTTCEVQAIRPWGLLVLRPLADRGALWPPRFVALDHRGTPAIRLSGPDPGTTVRVTTDGSEPTQNSPVFREPLSVESVREVRARSYRGDTASAVSVLRHLPVAGPGRKSLLFNGDFAHGTEPWKTVVAAELGKPDALEFTVEKIAPLGNLPAARLHVKAADGVPYHLRLTQPIHVPQQANLYLTAMLLADRPTRVRFGIQERSSPFRAVHVGVLEIGTQPRRVRLNAANPHSDLQAQLQLDLGQCEPGTTVWMTGVTVRDCGPP